jgi:transketolase
MELGRANLDEFGATLLEMGAADRNLLVVTSDSRGSGKLVPFAEALPDQVVEVGIAEQTLVGVAAGLASAGKTVFAVSPACFLTARGLEQIKNDVAYSDNPVNLIGISAGVSYGALGSTHHSLHDFAVLRAIHNISIVAPADNFETREAVRAAAASDSPIYIRFGKQPMPHLHDPDTKFEIGRAITLFTGSDVTFVASGETVVQAVTARELLHKEGVSCGVISMHTVKPLDVEAVLKAARGSRALITVEEHSVHGGLGGACAELLMQAGASCAFHIVGIPDEYTITGSQQDIFGYYGITAQGLSDRAKALLESPKAMPTR